MNTPLLLLVAAVLIVNNVLGCNDLRLAACNTMHGTKLTARRIADAISPNYPRSCQYLNEWHYCVSGNYEDCGDNSNVDAYNEHYDRLLMSPYNCQNIISTVLRCNDLRLAACAMAHGAKLAARREADAIEPLRNYAKSCEYIQDWQWCIADNVEGCGSDNVDLMAYNNEHTRLRYPPYNCTSSAVPGCDNAGLTGCTTTHGVKLIARRVFDEIESRRDYSKSCEYIQDWQWCIADNVEGCGSDNSNLRAYNNEHARLRYPPYNCTSSVTPDFWSVSSVSSHVADIWQVIRPLLTFAILETLLI